VYSVSPWLPSTIKKPSPEIARSEGFELISIVPCVKFGVISATEAPSPTCRGFVPPLPSFGLEPKPWVCKN
jgi:hypothetical protein